MIARGCHPNDKTTMCCKTRPTCCRDTKRGIRILILQLITYRQVHRPAPLSGKIHAAEPIVKCLVVPVTADVGVTATPSFLE